MERQDSFVACPRKRGLRELVIDYRERAIDQRITRARIYQPERKCMCTQVFETLVPKFSYAFLVHPNGSPVYEKLLNRPHLYICYACDTGGAEAGEVCSPSCCPQRRLASAYEKEMKREPELVYIRRYYIDQVRKLPLPSRTVKLL